MSEQNNAGRLVTALYQARADTDLAAVRELLHPEVILASTGGEAGSWRWSARSSGSARLVAGRPTATPWRVLMDPIERECLSHH